MSLNGIDISDFDRGINLDVVPFDFMICKVTEGTGIVHKTYTDYIETTKRLGKLFGFYHFLNKEDPIKQADFFIQKAGAYFGQGIPILDYEAYGMVHGPSGAKKFLDRVYEKTGAKPLIYMSRSVCNEQDWSAVANAGYDLWVAQYANDNQTGYQEKPWFPAGKIGAFPYVAIHQYTENGRLSGYNGDLDLDIAYMTKEAWGKYSNPDGKVVPVGPSAPSGTILELVVRTLNGTYGNGEDRKRNLGSRYDEVQNFINHVFSASINELAQEVIDGKYGDGSTRKLILGGRYGEVQRRVNQII